MRATKTIVPAILIFFLLVLSVSAATVTVNNVGELDRALGASKKGDTILLADGTYRVSGRWALEVKSENLTIRGRSGNRDAVVIEGAGMQGNVNHGFFVSADGVTIEDLTIRSVSNHGVQTDVNTDRFHLKNCVIRDTYEQLVKVPFSDEVRDPSEGGVVEGCLFEYSAGTAPNDYTGGIDVHYGRNWIVRNNTFRNIRSPGGDIAEHAVHFWTHSEGTLVEGNTIINCDRGIGFGLGDSPHQGGVIRNNFIYHDGSGAFADVGIVLESSPNTIIANNTIFFDHDRYPHAIEYRFPASKNVLIANNLTNKEIVSRDDGRARVAANYTAARKSWFMHPGQGDLHLAGPTSEVVDRGIAVPGLGIDIDAEKRPNGAGIDIGADERYP